MRTSHPMPCRLCRENARASGATFDCLAVGAIHAHRFSPVIYNETLCRYTSRNFPSFSRETTSETESAMKIGAAVHAAPLVVWSGCDAADRDLWLPHLRATHSGRA